jgi:hypothetical protein
MSDSPVRFTVAYPESVSRGTLLLKTFFGWLYVGIPHGIALMFYGLAAAALVTCIAWFAILFTGKYPRGMFDFVVRFLRWQMRVNVYMLLLTDAYPPFGGEE